MKTIRVFGKAVPLWLIASALVVIGAAAAFGAFILAGNYVTFSAAPGVTVARVTDWDWEDVAPPGPGVFYGLTTVGDAFDFDLGSLSDTDSWRVYADWTNTSGESICLSILPTESPGSEVGYSVITEGADMEIADAATEEISVWFDFSGIVAGDVITDDELTVTFDLISAVGGSCP